jgi:A118 family predicted phage portal protein
VRDIKTIQQYLQDNSYNTVSDDTFSHIDEWLEWYQGEVNSFHQYEVFNGLKKIQCQRYTLGMAKKICEDWANLLLNEKVSIKAGDYDKRLNEILEANNFRVRANQLLEITYALGTGAFVEYLAGGEVVIDYVRADMIYPLSWDNGDITECAFGSYRVQDGRDVIYLQIHRHGDPDSGENTEEYYLENHLVDADSGEELEPGDDTLPIIPTGSTTPLYQIITPNITNNVELDSPMGISVYANSISQLKGCDLIYDSYINEFVLGKKRIIVPVSLAKIQMSEDGAVSPIFDPSDTVYYAMPGDGRDEHKLTENNMEIRAADHELGIQRALDLLSLKCGMGTGRYQFDSSGVKTATEVISDKSDLYQNLKKNELPISSAIIGMVQAVAFLDGRGDVEATVDFDDSIIEDVNTLIDRNIKLVQAGLRSRLTAIKDITKCSDAEAKAELELLAGDNQITGQDTDWTDGDQDDAPEEDANEPDNEPEERG